MKNLIKKFGIFILIIIVLSGVFSLFSQEFQTIKQITLSQLVNEINQGNVKKIIVGYDDKLEVVFKDDSKAESTKEKETGLSQSLLNLGLKSESLNKIDIDPKKESGMSLWIGPLILILPIIVIFIFLFITLQRAKTGAMEAFSFTKAHPRIFLGGSQKEKTTLKDVGGLKEAKEELKEIVDFLKNSKKFLKIGARIPRGVLLMGHPGTGKTLLARAVASEAGVPFFSISGSEFIELFVGVGAGRVRSLFATARKHQPSIIFIDELDAIGRIRGSGIGGGHDEREQTLNQILVELDGFEQEATCIVMSATNRPDVLDPALLRPGRFDRRIVLDLPDINEREEILRIHCRKKPLTADVNLREIAERTPGFSGADLANVINEAAILAARKDKEQIYQTEVLESIEKVLLGPERKSHILSKKEKEIAAFHEAGHALVSALSPHTEPIRKISIIARGMAAGYTLTTPSEDRKIRTKSEFLSELAVLLGGYVAEIIKFKEITTGATNDIEKASDLARKLVKEYGMSPLGPVSFGKKEELVFLGKEIGEQRNYSEKIAIQIDNEVAKLIKEAEVKAKKIINKNKKLLSKIAETLVEKETIEKEDFEKIIGRKMKKK
ncbi:MAG: ATP-dependent zinc metalloprotease FtsH [Candidatus Nealsonbacteria bacterium]|nr:ATP-dependent zinc metalloprotease FtsH [Candidatus Nealsonbacteria bacterium]